MNSFTPSGPMKTPVAPGTAPEATYSMSGAMQETAMSRSPRLTAS